MGALLRLISLRHLRMHLLRSVLTTLGIALGVAAVVAMTLANENVTASLRDTTEQVAGKAELVVSGDRLGMPEEVLEKVRSVPGLLHAAPIVKQVVALKSVNGKPAGGMLQVFAVDALDDQSIPDATFKKEDLELEDPLLFLNQPRSLIVTRKFAERHGILDQADRAKLQLATSQGVLEFTVRGYLKSDGPEKVFGGNFALMDVYSAQRVFGKDRKFDEINVLLPPGITAGEREFIRQELSRKVGTGFDVERPNNRGRQSERLIGTWQTGMTLVSLITLFVGAFLIYNTVAVAVVERRREIGILRALGARRREVASMFALEALVMGLCGSALGVVGGIFMARALVDLTSSFLTAVIVYTEVPSLHLSAKAIVGGIGVGALSAVLSALLPAIAAARVSPLEATRPTTREPRRVRLAKLSAVGGVMLLGITAAGLLHPASRHDELLAFGTAMSLMGGFVLLVPVLAPLLARLMAPVARALFGVMGRIAAENLIRSPGRAAITVGAILIGFGLVISSSTIAKSFKVAMDEFLERTLPADVLVTATTEIFTPSSMPLGMEVKAEVEKVAGVQEVYSVRTVDVDVNGRRADLIAFDVTAWDQRAGFVMVQGDRAEATRAVIRGEAVIVSENFANNFAVKLGDMLPVRTPTGVERFRVAGVYLDYSSAFGLIVADWSLFRRYWDDKLADMFHVYAKPGTDLPALRSSIESAVAERYNAFVVSSAQFKRKVAGMIDDSFKMVRVQELIAILVALLGLLNTLLISVLERTREIGVLRAMGATRRHVAAIIVVEAGLMAVAGAALGVVLGAALSWVNVDVISIVHTGWRVAYHFDGMAALQMFGLSIVVAVLAAYLPSRRAARLNITDALEYE